jgi:molybdate transport system permease protein
MPAATPRQRSDAPFFTALAVLGGSYVLLVALIVAANIAYTTGGDLLRALRDPNIQASIRLSLISCLISAALSLVVAVPLGYLLARVRFRGKAIVEALVDIPVVLPPLVVGLSLLIIFNHFRIRGVSLDEGLDALGFRVTYTVLAVVLAQFAVAAAFAVRTMRGAFDGISPRAEQVALTLGCSRAQAFRRVALPMAQRGMLAAFTIAWARSLGEFGPLLVFAGTTRGTTEVLSTSVFLELSVGRLETAVAVSLLMIVVAVIVLLIVRRLGGVR